MRDDYREEVKTDQSDIWNRSASYALKFAEKDIPPSDVAWLNDHLMHAT